MLFRGDTPLTPDERLDYEYERELQRLRAEGLVMQTIDALGVSVWSKTLRGIHEFRRPEEEQLSDSGKLIRITFEMLDSSC